MALLLPVEPLLETELAAGFADFLGLFSTFLLAEAWELDDPPIVGLLLG